MSGFFTLGGKDHHQEQDQGNQENSLFLFKNEEIYNKGFELWQQYYQLHHQQKLQLEDVDLSLVGTGSASNYSSTRRTTNDSDHTYIYRSSSSSGFGLHMRQSGVVANNSSSNNNNMISGGSSGSGSINCQDCGNQAKKDCAHLRCRTCCKSRGFYCQTHVKSTWVPAAKRREKQQQLNLSSSNLQQHDHHEHQNQNQLSLMRASDNSSKRPRENPITCTRLSTHNSGLEMGQFPAEVSSSAVFRCVNVRAMDDAEEQYAYQTSVNIGGHVFKGLLYDQGPENHYGGAIHNSTGGGGGAAQQPLDLITAATTTVTTSNQPAVSWLDSTTTNYPTPLNAFMAGTQFFPPPRP